MSTILVADDHPLNRDFLATLLSYHRHEIVEAADGVEALDYVQKRHFDLAIVDVAMPRVDGFTFVEALRAAPELAQIPIVFCTASYRERRHRRPDLDGSIGGSRFTTIVNQLTILTMCARILATGGSAMKRRDVALGFREFSQSHFRRARIGIVIAVGRRPSEASKLLGLDWLLFWKCSFGGDPRHTLTAAC